METTIMGNTEIIGVIAGEYGDNGQENGSYYIVDWVNLLVIQRFSFQHLIPWTAYQAAKIEPLDTATGRRVEKSHQATRDNMQPMVCLYHTDKMSKSKAALRRRGDSRIKPSCRCIGAQSCQTIWLPVQSYPVFPGRLMWRMEGCGRSHQQG